MRFKSCDIQVDGCRVLIRQKINESHYNWVCVANFYHADGFNKEEAAELFAKSITDRS